MFYVGRHGRQKKTHTLQMGKKKRNKQGQKGIGGLRSRGGSTRFSLASLTGGFKMKGNTRAVKVRHELRELPFRYARVLRQTEVEGKVRGKKGTYHNLYKFREFDTTSLPKRQTRRV